MSDLYVSVPREIHARQWVQSCGDPAGSCRTCAEHLVAWVNANGGEARYVPVREELEDRPGHPARIDVRTSKGMEPVYPGWWVTEGDWFGGGYFDKRDEVQREDHVRAFPPCDPASERDAALAEVADLRRRLDDAESDAEQFAQRLEDAQSVSTDDEWLQRQHAAYHDMPGDLLGKSECAEVRCDFWDAAAWVVGPAITALSVERAKVQAVEKERDEWKAAAKQAATLLADVLERAAASPAPVQEEQG